MSLRIFRILFEHSWMNCFFFTSKTCNDWIVIRHLQTLKILKIFILMYPGTTYFLPYYLCKCWIFKTATQFVWKSRSLARLFHLSLISKVYFIEKITKLENSSILLMYWNIVHYLKFNWLNRKWCSLILFSSLCIRKGLLQILWSWQHGQGLFCCQG